jgi:hypothetical protein
MSHSLSFFQKIYVINLASRPDRRREMDEQLRRVGMSLASDGVEVFDAIRPAEAAGFPTVGSRGCFLSHLGVLKAAAAGGMNRILILEDDLNFADDFLQRMPLVVQGLQRRNWSIFHGGHRVRAPFFPDENGIARVSPQDEVEALHFVGLDARVFGSLIAFLEAQLARVPGHPDGGPMHVDGSYNLFRRAHPEFETWLAVPELGYQRASRTDIHPLQWRDRAWGVRNAVGLLRRMKNR